MNMQAITHLQANIPRNPDHTAKPPPAAEQETEPDLRRRPPEDEPRRGYAGPLLVFLAVLALLVIVIGAIAIFGDLGDDPEEGDTADETFYVLGDRYIGEKFTIQYPQHWTAIEEGEESVLFIDADELREEDLEGGSVGANDPPDEELSEQAAEADPGFRSLDDDAAAVLIALVQGGQTPTELIEAHLTGADEETTARVEVDRRDIGGHPAARMALVGEGQESFSDEVLLAIEIDQQVFLFTGYAPPDRTNDLLDLMVLMAETLTRS